MATDMQARAAWQRREGEERGRWQRRAAMSLGDAAGGGGCLRVARSGKPLDGLRQERADGRRRSIVTVAAA